MLICLYSIARGRCDCVDFLRAVSNKLFFRGHYCEMGSLSNNDAHGFENVGLFRLVQFRSNVGNFVLELNSKSYIEKKPTNYQLMK